MPEELVDGRDIVPIEGGDEEKRDAELCETRADEELEVLPVLAVRGGGYRDDRDRADLGGEERQRRGPPGHTAPREEEVDGVALLSGEGAPDDEEDGEDGEEDRVVRPAQRGDRHGCSRHATFNN